MIRIRTLAAAPALAALCLMMVAGCAGTGTQIDDPLQTLNRTPLAARKHIAAMEQLDADPTDDAYLKTLDRMVWVPQYSNAAREAAIDRLDEVDHDALMVTIRRRLPQMNNWSWLGRLCEIIADRQWIELTPALVSSWAREANVTEHESGRPEYKALARLHGEDRLSDVVFDLMVESRGAGKIGLRTRRWNLLHRLGERDRLVTLLESTDPPADDALLIDLRAAAVDLGVVPNNREEILWLRELRKPERADFWSQATGVVQSLDAGRRDALELRDIPILVSAARHQPELLDLSRAELYARVDSSLKGRRHYSQSSNFEGFIGVTGGGADKLFQWRDELTWGDLLAIMIALRAAEVPQVVDHFFRFAEEDRVETSTEFGGVITLDDQGRFEILEFPPVIRQHDQVFYASQAAMDAGYTALFHFHFHAQRHRNRQYAGPGYGDLNFATNTRANCLVLTFIAEDGLNLDFYRHGSVVVDLGVVQRR